MDFVRGFVKMANAVFIYEACPESKDTKILNMYKIINYKSDTLNELPVHSNFST